MGGFEIGGKDIDNIPLNHPYRTLILSAVRESGSGPIWNKGIREYCRYGDSNDGCMSHTIETKALREALKCTLAYLREHPEWSRSDEHKWADESTDQAVAVRFINEILDAIAESFCFYCVTHATIV